MKVLIDTNVLLWWLDDDPKLGPRARAFIAEARGDVLASIATFWEISIKWGLGKIGDRGSVAMRAAQDSGVRVVGIDQVHLEMLEKLEPIGGHNDPFDRLILVHAMSEQAMLMTSDRAMRSYDVRCYDKRVDR
ncbi:MAG: type II toxin-antitoxin system VapC family toxin [Novosphingobium sp.]|nr:type II toxin-antitoxin system VapC family toxin [Novosphingobium sp.]